MITNGQHLGHYQILEKIGEGGMGEVYRARDRKLGREVALKVLPEEVASNGSRRGRFEAEARAVAALNHPNIVTLHSIEDCDGLLFLTMELIDGMTLSAALRMGAKSRTGLPIDRFMDLAIPIVDAISAAHCRGITHRDLKPQNIVIGSDGRPKILDFGLARQTPLADGTGEQEQTAVRTAEGVVAGTVAYMSPEQALGEKIDHRSDIFSLGILFYEMLTGRRPFAGNSSMRIIHSLIHEEPEPIEPDENAMLAELARIVGKCMQKDPGRRYQSATELRVDLENLRSGPSPSRATTIRPRVPSRPSYRTLSILVLVIAGVVSLVTIQLVRRSDGEPQQMELTSDEPTKTIAVLPFRNLSPEEENAYFAHGVHEDLITTLAGLRRLRVISRNSVMRFAKSESSLREIGHRLGARYIVEGSVRREGNQVRVSATLVDATTDQTLWSQIYDRELLSVFAVQSAIAEEIATTLQTKISPLERRRLDEVPTVVVEAYDQFLRARLILNRSRTGPDELLAAITHLENATTADPKFARGWALLAEARSDRVHLLRELDGREVEAASVAELAKAALDRARSIDPKAVSTLRAEGYFNATVANDTINALRSYDRALGIAPDDSDTLLRQAFLYVELGQIDQAVANLERAYVVDQANGLLVYGLTFTYEMTHQYGKMAPFFRRLLELEPDKTHYAVQAAYFQFLADGSLNSFHNLEQTIATLQKTDRCDLRSVQNTEMVVALVNRDFETYAKNWEGKWQRHYLGHGNWACPGQLNEEANHAHLLIQRGDRAMADAIIGRARNTSEMPYTENSVCIFDRDAFLPKLDYLSGDRSLARQRFDESVVKILQNDAFPLGAVERGVLLETADMVAPDRVYSLYREITSRPVSLVGMEVVCANPWIYPNLLANPKFIAEVRKDGRFVQFLEHYGIIPGASSTRKSVRGSSG